jgi:mono/diheme cytochrome c family protein
MKKIWVVLVFASVLSGIAHAQEFPADQIKLGAETYARHCSPCNGARMKSPDAFDLATFPKDGARRFQTSVTKGKNAMPPWGGLLKQEEIDALWAYVVAGEK